ncbi:hypothetical protein NDU88_007094 [Pleurodeles waltl]|uniref:Uncharacterized protein n=1 Tax=Pleurodeles waltl TaxID=8319 RepID=A0AAV7WEF0_PLEWA|nr:hypothetical protein NDU88_007094 [Pleurodeles waltl]
MEGQCGPRSAPMLKPSHRSREEGEVVRSSWRKRGPGERESEARIQGNSLETAPSRVAQLAAWGPKRKNILEAKTQGLLPGEALGSLKLRDRTEFAAGEHQQILEEQRA